MAERNNNNAGDWFDQILSRKLLDVWDLAVCEQVSKDLQKKSNAPALWTEYLERLFRQFDQLVTKIEKYLKPLKQREKDSIQKKKEEEIEKKRKKAKNDLSLKNTEYKAEDTALDYLINTMGLFKKFSQKERQIIDNYARKEYVLLMVLMIDQLQETLEMVMDIYEEKRQITENFEIFDQTLRRYLVQITIMFPLTESKKGSDADVKDHPSLVITDPEARKIWESRIGPKAYCCTFDSFYAKVFEQDYGKECKNKDLVYYLGYFLNFPKDNIVTTYKWHLLTALFGPYPRFMANFKKYVLGKGFGGLINRLQSEDLLKKYPKHIMMRFSRTNPSYMAFSYNVDGYIAHITNNPSWWAKDPFLSIIKKDTSLKKEDAVPIDTFLEELFFEKGFALVPLRIDSSAVKNMLGLKDYASNLNGYLENHPDDSVSEEAEPESEEEPEDGGSYQAYERSDEPEEDNPNNRSTDMPLRGYSTLGSVPAPMSSSPARGMYVDALNTSVDSNLNKSTEDRKPNKESRELKGYEDETITEYLDEINVTSNTNTVDNGSHAVPPPNNRYVGMEDEADDKVGRYQDDLRFKSTEEAPSGYDTYKGTVPERTSAYDAYEVSEDKTEDDLVQADELSRLQQEEAQRKQEQAEKEAREKAERAKAEQEERDRVAREQAEKEEQDRLAREQAEREEQERLAREQAEKQEQERLAKEQEEQERLARVKAEQEERDRLAREQAEREEQERLSREQAEKQEQERLAREQAEREEQERLAREQAEKQEQERLAREKEEQERLAKEKAEREAAEKREEQERLAREKAEREAAQAKSAAAQKQTTPVSTPRGPPTDITPGSFTYDQLVTKPEGADVKKLEAYLSDESFESVFKMKRDEFYKMPQWKQLEAKKKAKLF